MIAPYLWIIDKDTNIATRVRVLRAWRWRGDFTRRRGVAVAPGFITRVVVDYCGMRRTFSVWRDTARFRLCDAQGLPEGVR